MKLLRILLLLATLVAGDTLFGARPTRLFEMGAMRFSRDDGGQGFVESGRLNARGEYISVTRQPTVIPPDLPDYGLGQPLIYTEAWYAYGQLGPEARSNFRLKDNERPVIASGLLFYILEPHPEARFDTGTVVNLSARGYITPGVPSLIGGFVITDTPRRVLVRAVGPGLIPQNVNDAVENPLVRLYRGETAIHENGDWSAGTTADAIEGTAAQVGAFPLNRGSKDAALLLELQPGQYTAHVLSENAAAGGTVLLEVYLVP